MIGPIFGSDALLADIADSAALATFMGEPTRLVWPDGYGLRRIPVTRPDARLPAFTPLAPRQPPSRAGHAARLPRLPAAGHGAAGTWVPTGRPVT